MILATGPATDSVQVAGFSAHISMGVLQTIWLMTAAGPATAGPVLDRRQR